MPTRTISPFIQTLGSHTGPAASVIGVQVRDNPALPYALLRVRVCDNGAVANATNATIAATNGTTVAETHTSSKDLTFKSPVSTAATGVLTVSGVVVDTETVTIGSQVFEFVTNAARTPSAGRIAARIDHANASTCIAAQGTLQLDTEPTAGDSMVIGTRAYIFVANGTAADPGEISVGTSLTTAETNILAAINGTDAVNTANSKVSIAAGTNAAATGTLTSDNTNVSNNDTVTIGTKTYTFKTSLTPAEGEIHIGGSADASLLNLINAINHTGTPDTDYKCAAANTQVSAASSVTSHAFLITALTAGAAGNAIGFSKSAAHLSVSAATLAGGLDKFTLTALAGGVAGNSIVSTKIFTATNNHFDAATLGTTTAGVDCSAAQAITALATAINAQSSKQVSAVGASTTLTLTAVGNSVSGNTIATTETMANGAFGGTTLSGGVSGNGGFISFTVTDSTAETLTVRFGPPSLTPPHSDGDYSPTLQIVVP